MAFYNKKEPRNTASQVNGMGLPSNPYPAYGSDEDFTLGSRNVSISPSIVREIIKDELKTINAEISSLSSQCKSIQENLQQQREDLNKNILSPIFGTEAKLLHFLGSIYTAICDLEDEKERDKFINILLRYFNIELAGYEKGVNDSHFDSYSSFVVTDQNGKITKFSLRTKEESPRYISDGIIVFPEGETSPFVHDNLADNNSATEFEISINQNPINDEGPSIF